MPSTFICGVKPLRTKKNTNGRPTQHAVKNRSNKDASKLVKFNAFFLRDSMRFFLHYQAFGDFVIGAVYSVSIGEAKRVTGE